MENYESRFDNSKVSDVMVTRELSSQDHSLTVRKFERQEPCTGGESYASDVLKGGEYLVDLKENNIREVSFQ